MKGTFIRLIALFPLLGLLLILLLALFPLIGPGRPVLSVATTPSPASTMPTPVPAAPRPLDAPPLPTPPPVPSPHPARPTLTHWSFTPDAGGQEPGSPQASLEMHFSRAITAKWVAERCSIRPAVPGQFRQAGPYTVAFAPERPWLPDTTYTVGVSEVGGQATFTFNTRLTNGPALHTALGPQESVVLSFRYPIDRIEAIRSLRLEPYKPFHWRWEDNNLVIAPAKGWTLDTAYTVTLNAAVVLPDLELPARTRQWTFRTRSGVLSYAPSDLTTACAPLTLTFDRPVDPTAFAAAFHLTPTATGNWEWTDGGRVARFRPPDGWTIGTSYQARLSPLSGSDGTALLTQPLAWHFAVQATSDSINFGYGPNVQVLDAAGPRRIQYASWSQVSCGTFSLYQLPPERLLADYSSAFKGETPIPIEGLPLVRQWLAGDDSGEVALPADIPPGLYVLAGGNSTGYGDRLIVVLTHYSLILKEATVGAGTNAWHQVAGYVSRIADGAPRGGAAVRLYDRSGRLYGQATTDDQGRFQTAVIGDTDPLLALGEIDGEVTLCGFGPEWNAQGGWYSWWGWQTTPVGGTRYRTYVYTDRPIYRPGQTVFVRAVVRADDDAVYTLPPPGTVVTVRLRDARDNVVATRALQTDPFGTVHTSFDLAEGGTLGTYHVEVVAGEEVTRQALKVEEYRKPDYEVIVRTERDRYLVDDTITMTVEARYYFGKPVAGASVALTLYAQSYDYWDCGYSESQCWMKVNDQERSGTTDAQGRWQVRLPARFVRDAWWSSDVSTLSLEATVNDGSGQAVSSHAVVQVYKARAGTTLYLARYAYKPGEDIPVDLLVHDYQGAPVPGAALRVDVYAWNGEGYNRAVCEARAVTDAAGQARATLRVGEQGWYQVRASGYGEASSWLWVYDPTSTAPWYAGQEAGLQVSVDKPAYRPGEVAQLLVRSPVTGTALLTLERGRVRQMHLIELTGPATTIPLMIEPDFVPNIFATVHIFRPVDPAKWNHWGFSSTPDVELLMASAELAVPATDRHLQVSITPERDTYAPREEAVIALQVTDAAGNPVRAELSLAVVDEAIFALSQDLSLDPFEAFYQRRGNLVRTYHSFKPVRELGGAERGGGGGGADVGNPRKSFPDTAYWNPAITTDEQGRAVVRFTLPDSLTRWRLVARAVTADTRLGEGLGSLTVAQPLVVRPALPRFLVQGDVFTLTASVHNYSEPNIAVQAGLLAEGLAVHSPLTYTLSITAGGTVPAGWGVEVTGLGHVTATAYAFGAGLSDAIQHAIPVRPFAVPEVQSWAGEYVGERIERFSLPAEYIPEVSALEVRLSPSVVASLLDGLEYLVGYPFG